VSATYFLLANQVELLCRRAILSVLVELRTACSDLDSIIAPFDPSLLGEKGPQPYLSAPGVDPLGEAMNGS
jgi:hypothetical protein